MKRRKLLTAEDHEQIAAALRPCLALILTLSCEVPNRCGKTHRAAKASVKAHAALDTLRSELDNLYCAEYGPRSPYYGREDAK